MTRLVGDILVIEDEEADICEVCGKIDELRPYGKGGARVCFDCMMQDEKTAHKKFAKLLGVTEQ